MFLVHFIVTGGVHLSRLGLNWLHTNKGFTGKDPCTLRMHCGKQKLMISVSLLDNIVDCLL